jgi:hypothetical protein
MSELNPTEDVAGELIAGPEETDDPTSVSWENGSAHSLPSIDSQRNIVSLRAVHVT